MKVLPDTFCWEPNLPVWPLRQGSLYRHHTCLQLEEEEKLIVNNGLRVTEFT